MSFAVVRHPDIETLGICPQGAYETQRVRGWVRVSEWRAQPADFHLPEFSEVRVDLDAEPETKPRKSPATPVKDERQAS